MIHTGPVQRIAAVILFAFLVMLGAACEENNPSGSNLKTSSPQAAQSELDQWLLKEYVEPYNVAVEYLWKEYENDVTRTLYPPIEKNVRPLMEVVKQVWIDPYTQVGGADFLKRIAPRKFVLVGGYNYNPEGTRTLGFAEAGAKIVLFNVDQFDLTDKVGLESLYLHTIQHEYTHILNQTKPFDPAFGKVNPEGFTTSWFNSTDKVSMELGFITSYARLNAIEDFAEMTATVLTNDEAGFDAIVAGISSEKARTDLQKKKDMVTTYFAVAFGINLDTLQKKAFQATEVITQSNSPTQP